MYIGRAKRAAATGQTVFCEIEMSGRAQPYAQWNFEDAAISAMPCRTSVLCEGLLLLRVEDINEILVPERSTSDMPMVTIADLSAVIVPALVEPDACSERIARRIVKIYGGRTLVSG